MVIWNPSVVKFLFIINFCLYTLANLLEFIVASLLLGKSMKKNDYLLILFTPLMPIYTGFFLRIVRTYAYLMEFVHNASYRDAWNPWKVSRVTKEEKL